MVGDCFTEQIMVQKLKSLGKNSSGFSVKHTKNPETINRSESVFSKKRWNNSTFTAAERENKVFQVFDLKRLEQL